MKYELQKNYNPLDRLEKWDPETQKVIWKRIANELGDDLSYEFLTEREGEILEFLVDALIPQEKNKNYVKISEIIDRDLGKNIKGVRYGENPWPKEFYQQGLADFAIKAKEIFGKPTEDFSATQIEKYISDIFQRNPDDFLRRFTKKVLADATAIYFSHPASWSEIGFPGPAFPEGYPHLDCGKKKDWEPNFDKK
jgi:hypothetical protein